MQNASLEVHIGSVDGQQQHGASVFPMIVRCLTANATLDQAVHWARAHSPELVRQAAQHGTVLFRDFPLVTAEDFDAFVVAFGLPGFTYEESLSNAVRINHTPRVFSANEAPPSANINLHHEMAQTPIHPSKLFFFCQTAAPVGGATSICRSDVLWERLQQECPEFAEACRTRGLKYTHTMPAQADTESGQGRSWASTFNATTQAEAEARMTELGYTWEWQADGSVRVTSPALPAVRDLPDGRASFFNQLIAALTGWDDAQGDPSRVLRFGDDSPLDLDGAFKAAEIADSIRFDVPWQSGDAVLIDNHVTMHGRRTFEGRRKVMAAFVA